MGIANELIVRGWTQGRLEDTEGRVCLRGAVLYACGQEAELQVFCWISRILPGAWRNRPVSGWNDAPERTFDEVLLVAKQADEILGL